MTGPGDWPLAGLRLRCGPVQLRPLREDDLGRVGRLQPDDHEHDPRAEVFPGLDATEHRARLFHQDYWRSMGTWSPSSWSLTFVVEVGGGVVGVQSLQADDFPMLRTVDSGSWLVPQARGRGVGVAMRTAVLALAFDHLGALAAVSSARHDNAASLGVSRHLGYRDNGVSLNDSGTGLVELTHLRLTRDAWVEGLGRPSVQVTGLTPALPWFGLPQEP